MPGKTCPPPAEFGSWFCVIVRGRAPRASCLPESGPGGLRTVPVWLIPFKIRTCHAFVAFGSSVPSGCRYPGRKHVYSAFVPADPQPGGHGMGSTKGLRMNGLLVYEGNS